MAVTASSQDNRSRQDATVLAVILGVPETYRAAASFRESADSAFSAART